jgi:molybdate transport system regulatory protein
MYMASARLSIRIDLASGDRIGSRKIALLEAIGKQGSISGAARSLGITRLGAWLLVKEINQTLRQPAVTAERGGRNGGGAALTSAGARIVALYRSIEAQAQEAAADECHAIQRLARPCRPAPSRSNEQAAGDRRNC